MSRTARDVTDGIDPDLFVDLPQAQRAAMVKLMARIAERSYRRGFQQGATIATKRPGDLPEDLHDWRYTTSTDQSPWADCPKVEPSVERLFCENHHLERLGFFELRLGGLTPA